LRRLLTGHDLNGELDTLPTPLKEMGEYLAGLDKKARPTAWQAMMAARPDRDELIKALADVDPLGPAPQVQTARFATAADVRRIMTSIRWLWEGWIPASRVVGIASLEGSEFRVFGIAVNSYATSRIERLSNHNIEKLKTCILYIICIN